MHDVDSFGVQPVEAMEDIEVKNVVSLDDIDESGNSNNNRTKQVVDKRRLLELDEHRRRAQLNLKKTTWDLVLLVGSLSACC